MRTLFPLFGLLVLVRSLPASQQTVSATPSSLAGWSVVGADIASLATQPQLSLPAGAQLDRSFNATALSVQLTTSPTISENTADWPVLEIGSAALVFGRSGNTGKLLLSVGTNAPVELPQSFALDAEGRSSEPLTVSLTLQGANVAVTFSGQTWQFAADALTKGPLDVVASAGAAQPWSIGRLDVTVTTPDPVAPPVGNTSSTTKSSGSGLSTQSSGASSSLTDTGAQPSADPNGGQANAGASTAAKAPVLTVELFTPPSVRYGRADTIRRIIQSKN